MSFIYEERPSDSPYLESVTRGYTEGNGSTLRPSEIRWHMVLVRYQEMAQFLVVGPWSHAGVIAFTEGASILWIKFKLGAFMPHLPVREYLDTETPLPIATGRAFWLHGASWQFPDYDNVETFVGRLSREETLVRDPAVSAALLGRTQDIPARTLRYRFLRATGLSQEHIHQYERAQQASSLLAQGTPVLDVVFQLGYYDQSHLSRMLKRFTGKTPAQLVDRR